MVICLSENGESNYLIEIGFRWWLRWIWATQGRWLQVVLVFQKAWGMFGEGLWVVNLGWNDLKLWNWKSVFWEETRIWSRVFLAWKAWVSNGISCPIYREDFGIIWRENGDGLLRKVESSKHAQKWNLWDKCGMSLTWYSLQLSWFCNLTSYRWSKGPQSKLTWFLLFSILEKSYFLHTTWVCLHVTYVHSSWLAFLSWSVLQHVLVQIGSEQMSLMT